MNIVTAAITAITVTVTCSGSGSDIQQTMTYSVSDMQWLYNNVGSIESDRLTLSSAGFILGVTSVSRQLRLYNAWAEDTTAANDGTIYILFTQRHALLYSEHSGYILQLI